MLFVDTYIIIMYIELLPLFKYFYVRKLLGNLISFIRCNLIFLPIESFSGNILLHLSKFIHTNDDPDKKARVLSTRVNKSSSRQRQTTPLSAKNNVAQ